MIDVVHFKKVRLDEAPGDEEDVKCEEEDKDEETVGAKKLVVSPVTIWFGIFSESASAMAAHNMAQDVLALLRDYQMTDVDIDYCESFYMCKASPQPLQPVNDLDPLAD
ncbi:hypothetical protein BS47DRAFT_1388465 [Hydnum rufescens UP504]|uniref:Uncharacterized protein n=1 Tax=Hydnum rufescens UP504 TaxID=1448309 RepID=A0A9P6B789_9AGAM|nr:hypothetical protein BS47DRAFT_1388465 [Hydnum rufescens UP504]